MFYPKFTCITFKVFLISRFLIGSVLVLAIFIVFCVVFFVCFVNYVPKVTSASGLVILDCPFGFPYGILIDGQGNVVSHFRNLVHNLTGISVIFSLNLFSFWYLTLLKSTDSLLPPVVCMRGHVLFTLFVFVCVQHILCCCIVFCLVCPMLTVFLDCPFLIAPSIFLMFI